MLPRDSEGVERVVCHSARLPSARKQAEPKML